MKLYGVSRDGRRLCARSGGAAADTAGLGLTAWAPDGGVLLVPRLRLDYCCLLPLRRPPGAPQHRPLLLTQLGIWVSFVGLRGLSSVQRVNVTTCLDIVP